MKRGIHRILALALMLCLLAGVASAALERGVSSAYIDLSRTVRMYSGTRLISEGKTLSGAQEHYLRYEQDSDVWPIVAYGSEIYGRSTMNEIAKKLADDDLTLVAGINGSFFDMNTGVPYGAVVTDGIVRTAGGDRPSVGFFSDATAIIGSPELCVTLCTDDGAETEIFYNKTLTTKNGIGLYSRDYDSETKNTVKAFNLLLTPADRREEAELAMNGSLELEVTGEYEATASAPIPEGGFVLAIAEDTIYPTALEKLKALDEGDCVTIEVSCAREWRSVRYLCAGSELLVEDGEVCEEFTLDSAEKRAARTAIGLTKGGKLVLYTVDECDDSCGMTLEELAERMVEEGCVTALNLDGGGSTALGAVYPGYASGATVNTPADGSLRACANYIFLVRESEKAGEASALALYPYGTQGVLPGAQVSMTVRAYDKNYMAASVPDGVTFDAEGGTVSTKGVLTVDKDATDVVTVYASAGGLETSVQLPVVEEITELSVRRDDEKTELTTLRVFGGSKTQFNAAASRYGQSVLSRNSSFTWTLSDEIGKIDESGLFTAAETAQKRTGTLSVSYGEVKKEIEITVIPENPFVDMKTHWAKDYVNELYLDGVLAGSTGSDGKLRYRPDDSMTRQEFIVALMRFLGVDTAEYKDVTLPYADNAKIASWAENAMKAAYKLGYMTGSSSGGKTWGKPEATISRQEAMVILARSQKLTSDSTTALDKFSDVSKVASWAKNELAAMVSRGVISGSGGKLNPTGNVTRAEVAKMLYALRAIS